MPRKRKIQQVAEEENSTTNAQKVNAPKSPGGKNATATPEQSDIPNPEVEDFEVQFNDKTVTCERRPPSSSPPQLIFTHGAGGGLNAPASRDFANGFGSLASIVSFKGAMHLGSRCKFFGAVYEDVQPCGALGGRSMGARAAVMTATARLEEHGGVGKEGMKLVLVSYPLVGAKKKDMRDQILLDVPEEVEVLFIIGDRDSMCPLEMLGEVRRKMKAKSWLVVVRGADHGMDLKGKRKGRSQEMREETGRRAARWLVERDEEVLDEELDLGGDENDVEEEEDEEVS